MKSQLERDPPVLGGAEQEQSSGEIKVKVQSINPESQTMSLKELLQKVQEEKEQEVAELTERLKDMEISHARDLEDMAQEVNICAEETQQAQDEVQGYKDLASQWETEAQIRGNMLAELRGQAGGMAATMDHVPRAHSFNSNEDSSIDFDSTLMSESQEEFRTLRRQLKKMEVERGIQGAKIKEQARKLALMQLREAKQSSRGGTGGTTRPGIDKNMSMKDIDMMGKSLLQVDDEVQDLNQELVSKDKTIQSLDKRVKKRDATIQKLEEENETLRKQLKILEQMKADMDESKKEREGMTLAMKKIASKVEKRENRIKELEKEIDENLETTELMEEEMAKQNQHIIELDDIIDEKEDQIESLRGEVSETLTKIDEMYDERDGKGSLISGLKNQVIELSKNKKHADATHSEQLNKMVADQKNLEEVIDGLGKDISERDLSIKNMEDERSSTLASTEEQLAEKQARIEELEQKVEASSLEITKLQEEINSVASERNSFDTNLSRLNELEAERDDQGQTLNDLNHELEATVKERDIAKARASALLGKVAHQTKQLVQLEGTEIENKKKIKVMEGELNEFHRDKIQWEMFNAGLESIAASGMKDSKSKKKGGEPNLAQMTAAFTASAAKVHSLQEELSLGRSRIREMEVEYKTNTADELEEMGNLHDRMVVEVSRCREELVRTRHYLAEYRSRNILLEQERKAKPIKAAEFNDQIRTMKRKLAVAEAQTQNLTSEIASFMLSYKCQRCDQQDKADRNFQEEKKESNRGVSSIRVDRNEIPRDEAKSSVR